MQILIAAHREEEEFLLAVPRHEIPRGAAKAMAYLYRGWSLESSGQNLAEEHRLLIQSAEDDPSASAEEIAELIGQSEKIQLLEALAKSFNSTLEEDSEAALNFTDDEEEAMELTCDYARALGWKLSFSLVE